MSGSGRDHWREPEPANPVNLYCLATMVADEASREGHKSFARDLESALNAFLSSLPREQQASALRLSFEMAAGGTESARPRLTLVYSRDEQSAGP